MTMKILTLFFLLPLLFSNVDDERTIEYQGDMYETTFDVPDKFIGTYQGEKSGYVTFSADGTGEYKYDIFGYAPASCERNTITFEWGFILDDKGAITKNSRGYGSSYPLLLRSTGDTSFQGCRSQVMLDYILEKEDGLHVSSSDDWRK